ncbi:acyltransferase family protein [Pseudoduganella sp. OTU4001]|uniref:acyltransferase family protein n=1 Tax=Pseudoduganella sp. OTU4001 TaxID=3043854 RepID=UPI00313DF360
MHNPNLDLLRAVAVLLVLAAHVAGYTIKTTPTTYAMGQLGVMLFFVHTSLVLMQSLERQAATGAALFRHFYIQRVFRIYPLCLVMLLAIYLLLDRGWSRWEIAANALLIQNLVYSRYMAEILWSLPLEVQMYSVLPLLYLVFRQRPPHQLFGLWALSVPLAMLQPLVTARLNVLEFSPCFLAGVLAWRIQGRARWPGWLWPLALGLASVAFIALAQPRLNNYGRWLVCLALGLVIPCLREWRLPWVNRVSKEIARYSYGLYLFHPLMLWLSFVVLAQAPALLQWGVLAALLVLVPWLAYHMVEQPMIRLGSALNLPSTVPARSR